MEIPFAFESPLCIAFWLIFIISGAIELLFLKKAKGKFTRFIYILILGIFMAVCEVGCQIITGWDLLLPLFGYMMFSTMAAGALFSAGIYYIYKKIKTSC